MCFTSKKLFWGGTDFTAAYLKIPQNKNIFLHWLILGHDIAFCLLSNPCIDSEHHYWKTIWKVLYYTGCPKKVTEFQIEMTANIWPRKSDHFCLKTEILSYFAGQKAFKAKLAFSH